MFHKLDFFDEVVDKRTFKIKNYDLAFKLKRHLEDDPDFIAYERSRVGGIMDYTNKMSPILDSNHKPSLLNIAITLLKNDLSIRRVSDITGLDYDFIEKIDMLFSGDDLSSCTSNIEIKHEIAKCLVELPYLTDEAIAEKSKLTITEIEDIRMKTHIAEKRVRGMSAARP